jgi:hypothetical protein
VCRGGALRADFVAGSWEKPQVLELADNLTMTVDGRWVVWAFKLARVEGDQFVPLTGRGSYLADATAACMAGSRHPHKAPDRRCSCGFHALSDAELPGFAMADCAALTVALSGRVLAFEWPAGGFLFRAERQTVVRVDPRPLSLEPLTREWEAARPRPDDPEGRLARVEASPPSGTGPARLQLPADWVQVAVADDAGWCQADDGELLQCQLVHV